MSERENSDASLRGQKSLFRRKVRTPVTLTLTPEHHARIDAAVERVDLSRSDVIGMLIELFADLLEPEDVLKIERKLAERR